MRAALTFAIVLGVSAAAQAQTIGLPLPSIGLPLPQIGLPLPSMGLPPVQTPAHPPRPSSQAGDHRAPRARPPRGASTIVYFVPVPAWPYESAGLAGPPAPPLPPASQPEIAPPVPAPEPATEAIAPEDPPPPATIYMIPGCYLGNVPPRQVTLPPGCDESGATVFPSSRR